MQGLIDILMWFVAGCALYFAFLPNLIAIGAGVQVNRRIYGMAMLRYKRQAKYSLSIIAFTHLATCWFIGAGIGSAITGTFDLTAWNLVLACCMHRIQKNYEIANAIQHPQINRS